MRKQSQSGFGPEKKPKPTAAIHGLKIRQTHFDDQHPAIATSLHTLAQIQQAQNHLTQAQQTFQQALSIRQTRLGPEHPDTVKTRKALEELEGRMGDGE